MSVLRTVITVLALAGLWLPLTSTALDTATELRLRSIEARLPDADKLAELERKMNAASGGGATGAPAGGMFSVLQDLEELKQQVRQLNGDVEELKYKIQQGEQGQRELYQNLDKRMNALEGNGGGSAAGATSNSTNNSSGAGASSGARAATDEAAAEEAYLAAFAQLKAGKYADSRKSFNTFVKDYPGSSYSDNAWYWLGEAHYVDREYAQAITAFRRVLSDYPDSSKAGASLYKIGVIQDEQGDTSAAQATLSKVVQQYPKDNAAELARKRLNAIGSNGARN